MKLRRAQLFITCLLLDIFLVTPTGCIAHEIVSPTNALWSLSATKVEAVNAIKASRHGRKAPARELFRVVNDPRFPSWHRRLCLFEYLTSYGKNVSLRKLLKDILPMGILRPENASHANSVTALPEPFRADRRFDCEYYAVQPSLAESESSTIIFEVQGKWEPKRSLPLRQSLIPASPFLQVLRGVPTAPALKVLRVGVFDRENLFPPVR